VTTEEHRTILARVTTALIQACIESGAVPCLVVCVDDDEAAPQTILWKPRVMDDDTARSLLTSALEAVGGKDGAG